MSTFLMSLPAFLDLVTNARSPVFYLHPDEVHFPALPSPSSYEFREACKRQDMRKTPECFDPATPVFYSAFLDRRVNLIAVTYWCFYTFSHVDVRSPAGFPDVGAHEGDWEWVGLVACWDPAGEAIDTSTIRYYAGQHAGGLTHETVFVEPTFENGRPVFYVARKSHSNYVDTGSRAGIDLEIAADRTLISTLYALSRPIMNAITWDPRARGARWQPPVESITSQPWFLNRGRWGNHASSPCSPIIQMHKPHVAAGVHTPVAFSVTPANLKFHKGTAFWQESPGVGSFTIDQSDGDSSGHHATIVPATGRGAAFIWQEMQADTVDGDTITIRARVRLGGEAIPDLPAKIKIAEKLERVEKHSEMKMLLEPGQPYEWHETRRVVEHEGLTIIRFEIWTPGTVPLLLDRLEVGVRSEGLISLEPGEIVKAWNELWFGKR